MFWTGMQIYLLKWKDWRLSKICMHWNTVFYNLSWHCAKDLSAAGAINHLSNKRCVAENRMKSLCWMRHRHTTLNHLRMTVHQQPFNLRYQKKEIHSVITSQPLLQQVWQIPGIFSLFCACFRAHSTFRLRPADLTIIVFCHMNFVLNTIRCFTDFKQKILSEYFLFYVTHHQIILIKVHYISTLQPLWAHNKKYLHWIFFRKHSPEN